MQNYYMVSEVKGTRQSSKWQTRISFKDQRWTGQRIEIYTDALESGERRLNS